MNQIDKLSDRIQTSGSFLCVGLDPDFDRIPSHLKSGGGNPITTFCKAIVDHTTAHCVAYKLNFAFFEAKGQMGLEALEETVAYIPETHFTIADAKRGDIGNTASQYAKAIFEHMNFDSVTLAPYMGRDAIEPFLRYTDKTVILLALTSNDSSGDFQFEHLANGRSVYEEVVMKSQQWAGADRMMYVVGATHPNHFKTIRKHAPDHFFLVPGVGAQGGSLDMVYEHGANDRVGILVNSSRGIIFAGSGADFAEKAKHKASQLHQQMRALMQG